MKTFEVSFSVTEEEINFLLRSEFYKLHDLIETRATIAQLKLKDQLAKEGMLDRFDRT